MKSSSNFAALSTCPFNEFVARAVARVGLFANTPARTKMLASPWRRKPASSCSRVRGAARPHRTARQSTPHRSSLLSLHADLRAKAAL